MGPRTSLDGYEKSHPPPGFETRTAHNVSNRYTDYAIPAHASNLVPLTEICKIFRPRIGWKKILRVSVQFADSFRKNSFPGGNPRLLAPYLRLFQWRFSASNRLAPWPAHPLFRPWIRSWVGPRTGLHNLDTRKSSSFSRESNYSSWAVQLLSYSLFRLHVWTNDWSTVRINFTLHRVSLLDSVRYFCASVYEVWRYHSNYFQLRFERRVNVTWAHAIIWTKSCSIRRSPHEMSEGTNH